ncbi:hypothetical protein ASD58_04630 [Duganella sp. Root1480D1]|nr:hypothetical protein ASD58_04630 [Duganella sp. Root1480D1]
MLLYSHRGATKLFAVQMLEKMTQTPQRTRIVDNIVDCRFKHTSINFAPAFVKSPTGKGLRVRKHCPAI